MKEQRITSPSVAFSEVIGGLFLGVLAALYSASYGTLLFTGPLAPHVSMAVGACLFSAFALGMLGALLSKLSGSVLIPQDAPAAILAGSAVAVAVRATGGGASVSPEAALAFIGLAALSAGACFLVIGQARIARFLRFIPYPVVGGLVAGTGWLIARGAIGILTGAPATLSSMPGWFEGGMLVRWVPSLGFALALLVAVRKRPSPFLVPGAALCGIAVFYALAFVLGKDPATLREQGWLLGPFPAGTLWHPPVPDALLAALRSLDASAIGNGLAMAGMASIASLFNFTAIELANGTESDLDHEMRSLGWANLASAAGGGCVGYPSLSLSGLAGAMGLKSRIVPTMTALVCGVAMWKGAAVLSYAPRPVMGGLLLFMGIDFLERWVVARRMHLPTAERFLIAVIVGVVAWHGFLTGVACGIITAAALFALEYARVEVVRDDLTARQHRSRVERSHDEQRLLEARGDEFWLLRLQGYVFFGTAHRLATRIIEKLDEQSGIRWISLDMHLVTGIDSSALFSFAQLRRAAEIRGATLLLCAMPGSVGPRILAEPKLQDTPVFADLDHAIEWWEEQTLRAKAAPVLRSPTELPALMDELTGMLGPRLEERHLGQGEILFAQGAAPDGIFFVVSGKLEARSERTAGRVKTLLPGTVVGEMGLYSDEIRSASVIALEDTRLLHLSRDAFEKLSQDPVTESRMHRFMARLLADRLRHATRELTTLWR